jgi:hypothetical protein
VGGVEYLGFGAVESDAYAVGDGRVIHEFSAVDDPTGHHYDNYRTGLGVAGGSASDWMDDAARAYFVGNRQMISTHISVRD